LTGRNLDFFGEPVMDAHSPPRWRIRQKARLSPATWCRQAPVARPLIAIVLKGRPVGLVARRAGVPWGCQIVLGAARGCTAFLAVRCICLGPFRPCTATFAAVGGTNVLERSRSRIQPSAFSVHFHAHNTCRVISRRQRRPQHVRPPPAVGEQRSIDRLATIRFMDILPFESFLDGDAMSGR